MAKVRASPVSSSANSAENKPIVGVIMGSSSDWETLRHTAETLTELGVPHEVQVVSAHRTPDLMFEYAASAESRRLRVSGVRVALLQ